MMMNRRAGKNGRKEIIRMISGLTQLWYSLTEMVAQSEAGAGLSRSQSTLSTAEEITTALLTAVKIGINSCFKQTKESAFCLFVT